MQAKRRRNRAVWWAEDHQRSKHLTCHTHTASGERWEQEVGAAEQDKTFEFFGKKFALLMHIELIEQRVRLNPNQQHKRTIIETQRKRETGSEGAVPLFQSQLQRAPNCRIALFHVPTNQAHDVNERRPRVKGRGEEEEQETSIFVAIEEDGFLICRIRIITER